MNTKKITALALAALMAAGTTTAAFAEPPKRIRHWYSQPLLPMRRMTMVCSFLDDGVVNPGDSPVLPAEGGAHDGKGITDKERDRINVYAD